MLLSLFVLTLSSFVCLVFRVSPCWFLRRVLEGSPSLLVVLIMNYNQPWATLGLAPQPQRENRDPNGSQGSANFHCIMVPGSPWSALRSLLRLQSAILTSTSGARDFVGGPKHRGSVSGSKTWTQLSRRVHQVMHLFTPGGANRARRDGRTESGDAQ